MRTTAASDRPGVTGSLSPRPAARAKASSARFSPRIQLARQLAVFIENKPGSLARLCHTLSEAKINIFAISTSDTIDHIVVRLVLSDPEGALRLFEERGVLAISTEVLMLDGSNEPGSLAAIAQRLSEQGINIEYLYCATHPEAKKGSLIMRVADPKRALKVLNS